MVTVIKPHKTRIFLDPRNLNEAIKREHFPLPTIEEVTARMPNAKVFQSSTPKVGFGKYLWMKPVVCCVRLTPLTDGTNLNAYHLAYA